MTDKQEPASPSPSPPGAPDVWTTIRFLSRSIQSRLGLKVAIAVFASILTVESLILVPSYLRYEQDLLTRLEHAGRSILLSNFRSRDHTDNQTLLMYGNILLREPELVGGAVYRPDGELLGQFGEPPEIAPEASVSKKQSVDGKRLDVIWRADSTGLGHDIVGRLDASWIADKLDAFVLRVAALVILISVVVCGTTMLIVGHLVLRPVMHLRRGVAGAEADPDRPDRYTLEAEGDDELHSVMRAFNRMINTIAQKIDEVTTARHQLEALNSDLERRVEERTSNLQESNRRLEQEIAERKRAEERIRHESLHDSLTGLTNRRSLTDRLDQALERAKRSPESRFAVILINLSRFRVVNDSLGHAAGDALLCDVAARLTTILRGSDTLARSGGDEFCLLADNVGSQDDVLSLVGRVEQVFKTAFSVRGEEITCGITIGIEVCAGGSLRPEQLLQNAKVALQHARQLGSLHAVFEPSMGSTAPGVLMLESELRRALDDPGSFLLHYQPVVTLETGELVGFEALVRWKGPDGNLVSPGEFIPLAEDTGLIIPLGRWVLEEGLRQLALWQSAYDLPEGFSVAFNVSGRQLQDPRFVAEVTENLERYRLNPKTVKLEVTESALLTNPVGARAMLQDLKALGVALAIDDFGTGYSSLSYLRTFPFDLLKIDRSFVLAMTESDEGKAIVRTIIDLAEVLRMSTVAEGVETEEDLEILRSFGCQFAQGFFYDRPLGLEEAERRLTDLTQKQLDTKPSGVDDVSDRFDKAS